MHCAGYGAELGIRQIVVPATSMAHSAYGALASDIHHSAERSFIVRGGGGGKEAWAGIDAGVLEEQFDELERQCRDSMSRYGIRDREIEIARSIDMRYRRQTHDLIIPVAETLTDNGAVRRLVERFERAYEDTYGRGAAFSEAGIELTTLRVQATGRTRKPRLARAHERNGGARRREREIYDVEREERVRTAILEWEDLSPEDAVDGPAVIEHPTTTVFVGSSQSVSVDAWGNLIIELRRSR
jgi:N-methylhydantoinase A